MGLDESRAAQPAPATPQGTPPGLTQPLVCAMCLRHSSGPPVPAVAVVNGCTLCAVHTREAPRSALPYAFGEGMEGK